MFFFWRKMDTRAIRSGAYKLIITRDVDSVMYDLNNDIDEQKNILHKEPRQARKMMKQLAEWEDKCCISPLWIEDGWQDITNGYHKRLMNNQIKTSGDLK